MGRASCQMLLSGARNPLKVGGVWELGGAQNHTSSPQVLLGKPLGAHPVWASLTIAALVSVAQVLDLTYVPHDPTPGALARPGWRSGGSLRE